jgi:DNA-binding response OmpR family regulator
MNSLLTKDEELGSFLPGVSVDVAEDFVKFEQKAQGSLYDCMILDVSLMEESAVQRIRDIRSINKHSGLIVTSSRDSLQERVEAIRTGADDFLTQPYDLSELTARVAALIRRTIKLEGQELTYHEIRVDQLAKSVFVNGNHLDLTKKELELLTYFIENKNSIVRKDNLISHLSGQFLDTKGNSDVLYAHVKNLKRKLTDVGCKPYLTTVYGIGYKWADT